MTKYGFYVSGGGVAALECIGAMLESLRDNHGIVPNNIVACSGGCIPSGLFLKGYDLLPFYKNYNVSDMIKMNGLLNILSGKSLMDDTKLKILLEELIGYDYIDNFYCNVTNTATQETYYLKGNCSSILASQSIPEVFSTKKLSSEGYILKSYDINNCKYIKKVDKVFDMIDCVDGGIYDLIPTPTEDDINYYDKIFILICNDTPYENITGFNRIKRSISTFMNTMKRECDQVIKDFANRDNIYIIKPPEIESHLLDFSKDFKCYHNAYEWVKYAKFN